ncbi:MAG TPA: ATP-binding protein [Bryobacteraceae bacterium]|nr:ATP-binding protein [Bryobacteraceae bacterium]
MPRRLLYALGAILFIVSVTLIVWQGSFSGSFGSLAPEDTDQTFLFYGLSILIFLIFVWLGFMIVRLLWKLWIERAGDRLGSRIKTKLVVGALLLSIMPVFFMVLFSVEVLNNSIGKWFNYPAEHERVELDRIARGLDRQTRDQANAEAELLASIPETQLLLGGNDPVQSGFSPAWLEQFCRSHAVLAASIVLSGNERPMARYGQFPGPDQAAVTVRAPVVASSSAASKTAVNTGWVQLAVPMLVDVAQQKKAIEDYHRAFNELRFQQKAVRRNYIYLLATFAAFILFAATWLADYLARQISVPVAAVLGAVDEVSRGNLGHRVKVTAVDEMAQLVNGFNRMTGDLEANRAEIEARRRFTEAILESIPSGVISVDSGGAILLVNKALTEIFPDSQPRSAVRLEDLFSREDAAEIRYLMNRARRTALATQQLEIKMPRKTLHLAVTVSAIAGRRGAGFVIVIEDTSDLMRAQRTAAWSEVARRVAHEIRNPLTPITLSAERILRQMNRQLTGLPPSHPPEKPAPSQDKMDKVVRECAETILEETASVKRLVDEFSQFSRLPAAQPVTCDLNDIVANGLAVFAGRLEGIEINADLAPGLSQVSVDPEQFKRVVVNLIDNAAEAMQDSATKVLTVQTRAGGDDNSEVVEMIFGDTGCGITAEQKEKLFLPYFSTKGRGTGLGLAIVSHILTEHNAHIRVEDNVPCGAWFILEVPVVPAERPAGPVAVGNAAFV